MQQQAAAVQSNTPKEPDLTAMEIAMRQAMEKADNTEKTGKKKSRKNKETTPEQDDLLSRTLENKVGQES
jgi:hypothetical protein